MAIARRVQAEVDCETSSARYVCPVGQLPGEGFGLPSAATTWLGVSIAVRASRTIADGASETATVAQLTVGPDGVYVDSIKPTNALESRALGAILTNASQAIKGTADTIEVGQGLADYLNGPTPTLWALTQDDHGWAFQGHHPGRIYHVPAVAGRPSAHVVIEQADGGTFVSIFPDVAWGAP